MLPNTDFPHVDEIGMIPLMSVNAVTRAAVFQWLDWEDQNPARGPRYRERIAKRLARWRLVEKTPTEKKPRSPASCGSVDDTAFRSSLHMEESVSQAQFTNTIAKDNKSNDFAEMLTRKTKIMFEECRRFQRANICESL